MKALIPSHKENKRYLLVKGKNLKKNVQFAIKEYVGTLGLSEAVPRWIEISGEKGILSINRKSLERVRAAFTLSKERIEVLKVSGTLKKLKA
jgi:RNase P/RNase MRP subunit POP5